MQKRYRLGQRTAIARVRQEGRALRHPLAVLLVIQNELPISRFGFSASRRVGKAVKRNRAKRLLREAVRLQLPRIRPGWDCLFIVRQSATEAAFGDVQQAVCLLLKRAQLMENG